MNELIDRLNNNIHSIADLSDIELIEIILSNEDDRSLVIIKTELKWYNVFYKKLLKLSQFTYSIFENKDEDKNVFEDVPRNYSPSVIVAVENEIKKRKLSEQVIAQLKNDVKEMKIEPLKFIDKIMFFFFFWTIIPWSIVEKYDVMGYEKKYKDGKRLIKEGQLILFFLILFFILVIVLLSMIL